MSGVTSGDDAYIAFLTNVEQFRDIDSLPTEVYFENDESVNSFATHCASWHKSCHLKVTKSKLAKAKKKIKREHNTDEPAEKTLRKRQALHLKSVSSVRKVSTVDVMPVCKI